MKKFRVYFEIFGHKMRFTVEALDKDHAYKMARTRIMEAVKFHKAAPVTEMDPSADGMMKDFMDTLLGKL